MLGNGSDHTGMRADHETYTHGHAASVLRSHTARTVANSAAYVEERLRPGSTVLDVGCGPGTITVDIARRVAPGRVLGIEPVSGPLEQAREHAAGVDGVEFALGDVYALDHPDGAFDVVHAHQVLQHLTDPVAALREMLRVCRGDGVVAARDADYAAMTWYPDPPELRRWLRLYQQVARHNGGEPDAGRRLLGWVRAADLTTVSVTASAWCFADRDDLDWWSGTWADRLLGSSFGEQAVRLGLTDAAELEVLAGAWRRWATAPDAWFAILHGEVVAQRSG